MTRRLAGDAIQVVGNSNPHNGEEETVEKAWVAFKKLFWEWHAWALKQPGKVTCMEQRDDSARREVSANMGQ